MTTLFIRKRNDIPQDDLDRIHRFRYEIFVEHLGWSEGLQIKDGMEFDEYDDADSIYFYCKDEESNDIISLCRIRSSLHPYMIEDKFRQSVSSIALPKSNSVYEITRFCVSRKIPLKSMFAHYSELAYALVLFGLKNEIKQYVALATDKIIPVMQNFVKWVPSPIGPFFESSSGATQAVLYFVNEEQLLAIRITTPPILKS